MIMHDIHDKTSLISRLFKSCKIPKKRFNPDGNWEHAYYGIDTYSIITNPQIIRKRNKVRIKRTNQNDAMSVLSIAGERYCHSQFFYFVDASLDCYQDEISTPKTWRYTSKVARKRSDTPYLDSGLAKEFDMRNGRVLVKSDGKSSWLNLPGAYTCRWCLLDAVQRMPKEPGRTLHFSMFDEFDALFRDQELRYRESAHVPTADGEAEVSCFEQVGTGTEPATYWLDSFGRVLFYLSGIDLLVLGEENGEEIAPVSVYKDWFVKDPFDMPLPG